MRLSALVPKVGWLTDLDPRTLMSDAIAGTILAILLVPQAMAYAQLAGLPPETGLFAALLPPVLYALFGSSAYVSVGPVAIVSLVIAETASQGGLDPLTAATIIAIEAGLMLALLGAAGLGRLVNFVSEPVLIGFTAAVAILICASQFPTLIGISPERAGDLPTAASNIAGVIDDWNPVTAAVGVAALLALLLINRYAAPLAWKIGLHPPFRQAVVKSLPLLVMIGAALYVALSAPSVATVDPPSGALPSPSLPMASLGTWTSLLPSALAVAIIIFVTATAVAKSLAGSDRSDLDTEREAVALGLGNIGAALTGGYAVGASLSRSALVEDSGGKTPLGSVFAALIVVVVILFLAPLLAYLPETALAALVISAVFGLVKIGAMKSVWRHDRIEGAVIAVAFIATLLLGVRLGLMVGAGAGLMHHLWFSSLPRVTRIGTDDGGQTFRSVDRDAVELTTLPNLIVRIDRSIYFGNAAYVEDRIFDLIERHEELTCLIIDMRAVNGIDASGADMLRRLTLRLRSRGMDVHFAALHQPVSDVLHGLDSRYCFYHRTVRDAVGSCGIDLDPEIAPT